MIQNNLRSLGLLWIMNIVMFTLTSMILSLFPNEFNLLASILDALLILAMVYLFVMLGNRVLKNQGSRIKNLLSVSLIFILGSLIGVAFAFNTGLTGDLLAMYFSFSSPIWALYANVTHAANGSQGAIAGVISIRFMVSFILSFVPSLLMWIGIERKQ